QYSNLSRAVMYNLRSVALKSNYNVCSKSDK
ncbi:MAG: hypothetical protein RIR87_1521, partial [Actinomycetota bacterium]